MSRTDDLLVAAAKSLKDGGIPLSHPWLVENNVTFNEPMDVAECMASAIHVYRARLNIALHETRLDAKEDRSLAEMVASMTLRQAGVRGALVEGARLEEEAQKDRREGVEGTFAIMKMGGVSHEEGTAG